MLASPEIRKSRSSVAAAVSNPVSRGARGDLVGNWHNSVYPKQPIRARERSDHRARRRPLLASSDPLDARPSHLSRASRTGPPLCCAIATSAAGAPAPSARSSNAVVELRQAQRACAVDARPFGHGQASPEQQKSAGPGRQSRPSGHISTPPRDVSRALELFDEPGSSQRNRKTRREAHQSP